MKLKKSKQPTVNSQAVIGDAQKTASTKSIHPKKVVIIGTFIIIILGLTSLIGYAVLLKNEQQVETTGNSENKTDTGELERAINAENDINKKAVLYSQLASVEQLNGNLESAAKASKKATELSQTASTYAQLAALEEAKGNSQKAIEYFEKAASLSEPTKDPDADTDYNYYTNRANYLRAQQ